VADKPKSKPMIRSEVKQEREKLSKIPSKSYLSYIPGVTDDKDIKDYLTEYFKTNKTGHPTAIEGIGTEIQMLVTVAAAKKMWDHCFKFRDVKEVMGLLIGKVYDYNEDKTISIARDVVTSDLDATVVNVKFDSFEKLFEQLDDLKYDYQIMGWYHSHPGHTCFMSSTDVLTQQRMFKLPYQHALVIDPVNNDMKCFILDQTNKKKVKARGYAIIEN
jgi:proteasome lid subunit RPN8/RPN11